MRHPDGPPSVGERVRIALLAALGAFLLSVAAACAGGPRPEPSAEAEYVEAETAPHVAADAEFVRDMLVHHAQALEMAALAPERTDDEQMRMLARRISESQEYEIELMRDWLEERDEPAPETGEMLGQHGGHMAGHAGMAGMASPAQMRALAEAEGRSFDRMFLELMIRHHEGALVMLDELAEAEGAGQEPQLFILISHIDADQRAEIARMRRLLDQMTSTGGEG